MTINIPVEIALAVCGAVGTASWALWSKIAGARTECLASVASSHLEATQMVAEIRAEMQKSCAELRAEHVSTTRELYALTDRLVANREVAMARIHDRIDELQASSVSKADLEPLREDIRQMRTQTSNQMTSLTADIHKLLSAIKG